jgi:hypothetical protein
MERRAAMIGATIFAGIGQARWTFAMAPIYGEKFLAVIRKTSR